MTSPKISSDESVLFERLLDYYLGTSEKILQRDKILIPMGVRSSIDGELSFVGLMPADDEGDVIDTVSHLKAYRAVLRKTSSADNACLLAYDVKLKDDPEYTDAIAVEIESKKGTRIRLYFPYKFTGFRKNLSIGEARRVEPEKERIYK